ncbi:MAG TPA: hypothetical protein VMU16_02640 [Candidatus Binataceae bacterium]|nr:hypothetical protein [Candidatus Binataceae bacterium]
MKFRIALFTAALMAFSVCAQAKAATPKLSGTYTFSFSQTCQASIDLSVPAFVDSGSLEYNFGTAAFNATSGKYTFNGFQINGSLVLQGSSSGDLTKTSGKFTDTFGVTSTTLVLGNQTYGAAYAGINGSGIATQVNFMSITSSTTGPPNCLNTGSLIHQ